MRLWSLHPTYLDAKGLVALWREGLLAKAVLAGRTRGYTAHPQLQRFRAQPDPLAAINAYLHGVLAEATARGYRFDANKLQANVPVPPMTVTRGQLNYEARHLAAKLLRRDPTRYHRLAAASPPAPHPLFRPVAGPVAPWEVVKGEAMADD